MRSVRSAKNYKMDRTPEQQYRNDPARIDEQPGPWKNYTDFNAWRKRIRGKQPFDPDRISKMLEGASFETENDLVCCT